MVKQHELRGIAEKHKDNPAVSALLVSLTECQMQVRMHGPAVQGMAGSLVRCAEGEEGLSVSLDNSDFVMHAVKMGAALSRMASDYSNLACVLESLGEDMAGY